MSHDKSVSPAMRVLAVAELSQVSGGTFNLFSLFGGGCSPSPCQPKPKTSCHSHEDRHCTPPVPAPVP